MRVIIKDGKKETELIFNISETFRQFNGERITSRMKLSNDILKLMGKHGIAMLPETLSTYTGTKYYLVNINDVDGLKHYLEVFDKDRFNLRRLTVRKCRHEVLDMIVAIEDLFGVETKILP